MNEQYEPFGQAWENEMMKLKKIELVKMLRKELKVSPSPATKPLTVEFLANNGFKKDTTVCEEEFSWDKFILPESPLTVFMNYYNDGKVTWDIELDGWEFENLGQDELLTLLRMLPK